MDSRITSGFPGAFHSSISTDVCSALLRDGSREISGSTSWESNRAKYSADFRDESTVPRLPKPNRVILPPPSGLMGSAVPFMIMTGMERPDFLQSQLSL